MDSVDYCIVHFRCPFLCTSLLDFRRKSLIIGRFSTPKVRRYGYRAQLVRREWKNVATASRALPHRRKFDLVSEKSPQHFARWLAQMKKKRKSKRSTRGGGRAGHKLIYESRNERARVFSLFLFSKKFQYFRCVIFAVGVFVFGNS